MRFDDLVLTPVGLRFRGRLYPCSIGKTGVTSAKMEGDGATPRGVHRICGMLYRPDRVARPNDWAKPIRLGDLWSDASGAPDYNQLVRAPYGNSHEALRRADPLYDLIFLTDWNYPHAKAGKGSAIFVHQWRKPGHPTEGCVALRMDHLHQIAVHVTKGTRLVIP